MSKLEQLAQASFLLKYAAEEGGVLHHTGKVLSAIQAAANRTGERVKNPLLSAAIKAAPTLAVAGSGVAAYQSDPVQRLRARYQMWKYNRQMRRAQGG